MQHSTTHISHRQMIALASKKALRKNIATVRSVLANETIQKVILFASILALLALAANLDNIL